MVKQGLLIIHFGTLYIFAVIAWQRQIPEVKFKYILKEKQLANFDSFTLFRPSGVRNDFRGEVSGPLQEDGFEEVVILQEDYEVSLEDEDKKEIEKKKRSAALGFSRRYLEKPPTYDELIERILRVAFPEELEMELEILWEERFF